jgi:hypothetical protein
VIRALHCMPIAISISRLPSSHLARIDTFYALVRDPRINIFTGLYARGVSAVPQAMQRSRWRREMADPRDSGED